MSDKSKKPIVRIGCSLVLSGDENEAAHCRHLQRVVELAAEQANSRENLPFQIETLIADDQLDREQAIAVAQQFIADERILGVVGTTNSDTSLATAPVFHRAGLVQIAPSVSNIELTRQGYNTFFRLIAHDGWQGVDAARYAVSVLKAQRIAVLHDSTSFGEPLAEIFRQTAEELGAQIVLYRGIQRGETNFSVMAEQVKQANPDLIYFALIEAEGQHLAPQIRAAGVRAVYFGSDGLKPSHFLATPGSDVPGPYHTNAGTDIWVTPSASQFAQAYKARYGEAYSIYTAEVFDAMNILIDAFTRAERLDRPNVRDAVAQTRDFPGASGRITFDEYGDIVDPKIGLYRLEGENMRFLGYTRDLLKQADLSPTSS